MAWFCLILLMSMLPVYRTLRGCSSFRQSTRSFLHAVKTKTPNTPEKILPYFNSFSSISSLRLFMSTSTSQSSFSTQTKPSTIKNHVNNNSIHMKKIKDNGGSLALNILVDPRIRSYLQMKNHERKSRVLLPADMNQDIITIQNIRELIEKKLNSLSNQPYILRIYVPGSTVSPKQFTNDQDLYDAFVIAQTSGSPSVQVYIDIVPGIFPPTKLDYLQNMADPMESNQYTLLSFYTFNPIKHPEETIAELRELWKPFNAVGRIYVATEGVNAQMAIPTNVLPNFAQACKSYTLLCDVKLNTDHEMTREEFDVNKPFKALHIRYREQIVADGFGTTNNNNNHSNTDTSSPSLQVSSSAAAAASSSSAGTIRFDWNKAGREMPPLEWHDQLDNPEVVVLDCRNSYESDVGRFDKAIPLNTTFFRESWQVLDELLENTPKDAPIMTYCTGGIRCVKINAYLEQKLGFRNVARLQGGIVSYTRELAMLKNATDGTITDATTTASLTDMEGKNVSIDTTAVEEVTLIEPSSSSSSNQTNKRRDISESKFRGVNYVFDERMGSAVTAEVLAQCDTCGDASDAFTNCKSDHCHIRFIQCEACRSRYDGCCSAYCQLTCNRGAASNSNKSPSAVAVVSNKKMIPRAKPASLSVTTGITPKTIISSRSSTSATATSSTTTIESSVSSSSTSTATTTATTPAPLIITSQNDALSVYCDRQSVPEPFLLSQLRHATENAYINSDGALRMLCSVSQGRLFTLLTQITGARNVLELGSFTGYSALCFAEGIASNIASDINGSYNSNSNDINSGGKSSSSINKYGVVTCDIDDTALALATKFTQQSEYAHLIDIRQAPGETVIDALVKENEQIQSQERLLQQEPRVFDIIFIDADKKQYQFYIELILSKKLLKPNGLILVDNTLWKGLVLHQDDELKPFADDYADYGKKKRMIKLTQVMHDFNIFLKNHKQLQPLLLPMRDGLTLVRYSP